VPHGISRHHSQPGSGCSYLNYPRAVLNTPHPIYGGNLAGFGVGDLPTQFESGIPVFTAITANETSGLIDVAAMQLSWM